MSDWALTLAVWAIVALLMLIALALDVVLTWGGCNVRLCCKQR